MPVVTKEEAVRSLITGALRAYDDGDFVCALTLAGAAEGAMPPPPDSTFHIFRDMIVLVDGKTEKAAADELNAERNWLKHNSASETSSLNISSSVARLMLARAWSCFACAYGEAHARARWPDFFTIARKHQL